MRDVLWSTGHKYQVGRHETRRARPAASFRLQLISLGALAHSVNRTPRIPSGPPFRIPPAQIPAISLARSRRQFVLMHGRQHVQTLRKGAQLPVRRPYVGPLQVRAERDSGYCQTERLQRVFRNGDSESSVDEMGACADQGRTRISALIHQTRQSCDRRVRVVWALFVRRR